MRLAKSTLLLAPPANVKWIEELKMGTYDKFGALKINQKQDDECR